MSEQTNPDEQILAGVQWAEAFPVFYLTEKHPEDHGLFTRAEIARIEAALIEYDFVQDLIASRTGWDDPAPTEQENT